MTNWKIIFHMLYLVFLFRIIQIHWLKWTSSNISRSCLTSVLIPVCLNKPSKPWFLWWERRPIYTTYTPNKQGLFQVHLWKSLKVPENCKKLSWQLLLTYDCFIELSTNMFNINSTYSEHIISQVSQFVIVHIVK